MQAQPLYEGEMRARGAPLESSPGRALGCPAACPGEGVTAL